MSHNLRFRAHTKFISHHRNMNSRLQTSPKRTSECSNVQAPTSSTYSNEELCSLWKSELESYVIPGKKEVLQRFFKTGKGEYGEGDIFLGIVVPDNRKVARMFWDAPSEVISEMILSPIHEFRLSGFLALVKRYEKSRNDPKAKNDIIDFYLKHAIYANNWDLVDLSAPKILGEYVAETGQHDILYRLMESENLWEQRISIVSTYALLCHGISEPTIKIATYFLSHPHDLMRKATGWMLREMGKRVSEVELCRFLDTHARIMPRTMLRYAIERLPQTVRKHYMGLR